MIGHVIDHNLNTGSGAAKMLQKLQDKTIQGIATARKEDYALLVQQKPSNRSSLQGWYKRVDKFTKAMGSSASVPNPSMGSGMLGDMESAATAAKGIMQGALKMVFGSALGSIVSAIAKGFGITIPPASTWYDSISSGVSNVSGLGGATLSASAYNGPVQARSHLCPNADHGPRGFTQMIIMHRTGSNNYTPNYQRKCGPKGLAAHFTIERNGRLNLDVNEASKAWHAGPKYNNYSIGIEVSGKYVEKTRLYVPMTEAQKTTLAALGKYLAKKYNLGAANIYSHKELVARDALKEGEEPRDFLKAILKGKSVSQASPSVATASTTEGGIKVNPATSNITPPAGTMYIPAMGGSIPTNLFQIDLMRQNNKYLNGELNELRSAVDKLSDSIHTSQDGNLTGIIQIEELKTTTQTQGK